MERVAERVVLIGLYAVLAVPLIVASPLVYPFITGKAFYFFILIALVVALWLPLALLSPAYRPAYSPILIALAAFIGVMGVATLFSVDPSVSFASSFERMEGLLMLLHVFAYALILMGMLKDERQWRRYVFAAIGVSVLVALHALFALLTGAAGELEGRVGGTLGNPVFLASYLLLALLVTVFALAHYARGTYVTAAALSAAALVQGVALVATQTRGALLGLLAGMMIFLAGLAFDASRTRRVRLLVGGLLVAVVFAGASLYALRDHPALADAPIVSRVAHLSIADIEREPRYWFWRSALQGIAERPVLGWGLEHYAYVYNYAYAPELTSRKMHAVAEPWMDRAHNSVLDWTVAGGVLGGLAYLGLFFAAAHALFFRCRRTLSRTARLALGALFGAYLLAHAFTFEILPVLLGLMMVVALVHRSATKDSAPLFAHATVRQPILRWGVVPLLGCALLGLWYVQYREVRAAHALFEAQAAGMEATRAAEKLRAAQESALIRADAVRGQILALVGAAQMNERELSEALVAYALARGEKQRTHAPYDLKSRYWYATLLRTSGSPQRALDETEALLQEAPRKPQFWFAAGAAHRALGNHAESLDAFTRAYQLAPHFDEARRRYAVALVYAGRAAEAQERLTEWFGSAVLDYEPLLRAYLETKEYPAAAKLLRNHLDRFPKQVSFYVSLAAVYVHMDERDKAIAVLEELAAAIPDLASVAAQFIEQIEAGETPSSAVFEPSE